MIDDRKSGKNIGLMWTKWESISAWMMSGKRVRNHGSLGHKERRKKKLWAYYGIYHTTHVTIFNWSQILFIHYWTPFIHAISRTIYPPLWSSVNFFLSNFQFKYKQNYQILVKFI